MTKVLSKKTIDRIMAGLGIICIMAILILTASSFIQMPVAKFFSETVILTLLPVVAIYLWTEKIVEWMNVDSKVMDAIALTIRVIAVAMFLIFAGFHLVSMYRDLPYALNYDFAHAEGKPVNAGMQSGMLSKKYMFVNGIKFSVGEKIIKDMDKNAEYRVKYLPHSRYVIEVVRDNITASKEDQSAQQDMENIFNKKDETFY